MAIVDPTPLVLKDVLLKIGTTDSYEKAVSGVTLTPASSAITFRGLKPDAVYTDPGSVTWTCVLNYVQDWSSANSLSRYLYDHEGQTVPCEFQPRNGSGPTFAADVIIIPGAIGGQVNTYATTSVTLGVQGRPELVPATPPTAWTATTAYVVDDRVSLSGGEILRCTAAGTSGSTEPAPPGIGNTVVDGDVAWLQTA